jgi:putative phosphoesterase
VRLLLLSDSHIPARARDLPAEVWEQVDAADVVIHAGDWISADLVDRLGARAARLVACWGNNDGPEVRAVLPEVARVTLAGVRFVVTHETGASATRDRRMAAAYPDADVLVFGHSHIPWDSTVARPGGAGPLRLLNPGSPTDRRREPSCTYLTAAVEGGVLRDVDLHHLVPAPSARSGTR